MNGFKEFEVCRDKRGRQADIIRLSIYRTVIHYSKNLLELLGNPKFLKFHFDTNGNRLAITAGSNKDWNISNSGSTCSKALVHEIMKYCTNENPKFDGYYDETNKAVVFDFNSPV